MYGIYVWDISKNHTVKRNLTYINKESVNETYTYVAPMWREKVGNNLHALS